MENRVGKGNRTNRRGIGAPPSRILIKSPQGAKLRALLRERHGYEAEEAIAALISGELATVLIGPEEQAHLLAALEVAAQQHPFAEETLRSLVRQLRQAWDGQ